MNKLTLNYDKCKYMIVCGKPIDSSSFALTINNVKIKRKESIRYLGEQLDEKLLEISSRKPKEKTFKNMWINF